MNARQVAVTAALASVLFGCGQASHQDLEDFTQQVRNEAVPGIKPIEPLPELQSIAYTGDDYRNPFMATPIQAAAQVASGANCPQPDLRRQRGELETVALDQLSLTGTLRKGGDDLTALVISNQGRLYRVEEGDYIGLNHGKVVAVTSQHIAIREWLPTGEGCWQQRDTTLSLAGSQRSSDS
ncbi:pilus assembly protein PilP [Pseudidiomarina sp.]|uniref:pilus assembly protein PilP n=1 Tax=Pseudidiomarina sp. TaxID=2081707 RepID=UPI00299D4C67|nr:pilus assembly protein PilP [Pseudidiomarina sp.]MDX1706045.1 pilus assembly protein PilP [Pseudidiomarina sp.]